MTRRRIKRERAGWCRNGQGKRAYENRRIARNEANRFASAKGVKLYAYKCPECGLWHITKQEQLPSKGLNGELERALEEA